MENSENIYITEPLPSLRGKIANWFKNPGFQKYLHNTGWLLLGRVFNLFISFFSTIFIVRHLGPTNYGQLSYAVSFTGLFTFIYSLGLDQILYRDLIKFPEEKHSYLGTAFVLKLIAGLLTTILCIGVATYSSTDDISLTLIYIISLTFAFNAFGIITYEFQARVQSKTLSIIGIAVSIILNALKILVLIWGKGVLYFSIILAFESVLNAGFYFYFRTKKFGSIKKWTYDNTIAKKLLKDSWPMIFANAFALIYIRIDQVLIKGLINTTSVGLYDAAVRIAEAWYFIPTLIASSVFPAIINAKKVSEHLYRQRLLRLTLLLFIIASVVALPTTFLAGFIMKTLYGPLFVESSTVLKIYIWGGVGTSLGLIANFYLLTENKMVLMFCTSLVTMVANIVLNLVLIPHYGIVGSAWATFISYLLLGAPLLLLLRNKRTTSV